MAPEWNCFIPRLLLVTPVAVTLQLNLILCLGRCLVRCVGIIGGPLCQAIKVVSWDEMSNSCIQCVCYLRFGLFACISIVCVIPCDFVCLRWLKIMCMTTASRNQSIIHLTWPSWKKLATWGILSSNILNSWILGKDGGQVEMTMCLRGVIKLPIWGNQKIQTYGMFEGFPL